MAGRQGVPSLKGLTFQEHGRIEHGRIIGTRPWEDIKPSSPEDSDPWLMLIKIDLESRTYNIGLSDANLSK
jgi:hypothetical protein